MKLLISRQLKITVLGAVKFLLNAHLWLKKGQLAGVIGHRHFQLIQEWERWLCLHPENQHLCRGCTSLNKCEILQQFQFRTWSSQKINPEEKKKGRGGWKISFLLGADPVFGLKGVWDWKLWLSARPGHLKTTISQKYYNARNEMQNNPRNIIAPLRQENVNVYRHLVKLQIWHWMGSIWLNWKNGCEPSILRWAEQWLRGEPGRPADGENGGEELSREELCSRMPWNCSAYWIQLVKLVWKEQPADLSWEYQP